ncbi:hypothetical protein L2K70_11145 [Nocardioides KLBMP 9356]|uniref:Uncharacterized protein n=1 Tax=Nocardioides potassii TaxID=2911371 RepID=A0ABS9HDK3_9ACTN|nr:UPF0158 family protein [Nocardioides potassii]MCF6378158.1 hypothetical protein [Nocardioides potassii]
MMLIDADFRTQLAGFRNFRALIGEAHERGLVDARKPLGATDVVITLRGGSPSSVPDRNAASGFLGGWLRRDLWLALNDWTGCRYAWDPGTRRTRRLAGAEHDTEPQLAPGEVLVPVLGRDEQHRWMREFTDDVPVPPVRADLEAALASDHPLDAFRSAVWSHHQTRRRWEGMLRHRLMDRARDWARAEGIDYNTLLSEHTETVHPPVRQQPAGSPAGESARDSRTAPPGVPGAHGARGAEEELRRAVLAVLADLPLGELLRLPIPLEHVLRR